MASGTRNASGTSTGARDMKQQIGGNQVANGVITGGNNTPAMAAVNRKKQKRRQKEKARQAATQEQMDPSNDLSNQSLHPADSYLASPNHNYHNATRPPELNLHYAAQGYSDVDGLATDDQDQLVYSDEESAYDPALPSGSGSNALSIKERKSKKKGRRKASQYDSMPDSSAVYQSNTYAHPPPPPPPPPPSDDALRAVQRRISKDPIWDTSNQEERQRIKEFWLSLGEDDRKALVKIEKEAVLRKMKEQQKHSCSCTVCGRKRTAIEEELEMLYDAYYKELEQFANNNQGLSEGGESVLTSNNHKYVPSTGAQPNASYQNHPPDDTFRKAGRGRIQELPDDGIDDTEWSYQDGDEYSEEDYDEDEYSENDTDEMSPDRAATDFFAFGNSLTVKEGILTVADDLLKNDGQKFIDMMEQLAERRMQREQEAYHPLPAASTSPLPPDHRYHPHDPPDEDEFDEDEEDEFDSQDEEYEEEDEMDQMTEQERMAEGKRMFQIFAARMFEQRVLTAYREKVAEERQQKLIEELEAESRADNEKDAKRARDAEKKKFKKQQQKQKQAEEKARREAEKAAEEAATKEKEAKKQEELRLKRDEQRKKKEAERKAIEEERLRKEAERVKRQEAERERQQEAERKAREAKAEEKKKREEAKKREKEERESREKETRDKKAKEDRDRKERDVQARAGREVEQRRPRDEQNTQTSHLGQISETQAAEASKRPSLPAIVALPPSLSRKQSSTGHASPQAKIATPVMSKSPTPSRSKETSNLTSQASTPQTPESSAQLKQQTPPKPFTTQPSLQPQPQPVLRMPNQYQLGSHAPPSNPAHANLPPGMHQYHAAPMNMNGFLANQNQMMHGIGPRPGMPMGQQMPIFPPHNQHYAPPQRHPMFPGMTGPPSMGMPHVHGQNRAFASEAATGFPASIPTAGASSQQLGHGTREQPSSHMRQPSNNHEPMFDQHISQPPIQPIGSKPAPIKRPSSVKPNESEDSKDRGVSPDIDELGKHLGSSALIGDDDEPLPTPGVPETRRTSAAPGMPTPGIAGPIGSPLDQFGQSGSRNSWRSPSTQFGPPGMSTVNGAHWGAPTNKGWGLAAAFPTNMHRPGTSRPATVRILACQACQQLQSQGKGFDGGFQVFDDIIRHVADSGRQLNLKPPIYIKELRDIFDTEGDSNNGGGSFAVRENEPGRVLVRWDQYGSDAAGPNKPGLGPGQIGSPVAGSSLPSLGGLGSRGF